MKNILIVFLILLAYEMGYSQSLHGYTETNDIQYYHGTDADTIYQKLNLVMPGNSDIPPLLIWIGGGAWSYGDRNMEMDIARKFVSNEIAVASISHRMSPATWKDSTLNEGIRHPEHIKDVAKAIKYLYVNADRYGYSRKNIFVGGYSSGAHLAALVCMDGRYLRDEGISKDIIKGVVPIAGTYDILHYYKILAEANGPEFSDNHVGSVFGLNISELEQASPSHYIDSLTIPMLLISETNTFKYTKLFEDKLTQAEFDQLEVLHIHRLGHGELWRNLSYASQSIYRDLIVDFVKRNMDKKGQDPE